jgi:phosphoesterase RecJ-like protein
MKVEMKAKLVWFKVSKQLLKRQKIFFDLSETLLSFARTLKGMEVAILFRENLTKGHEIRVNMRSQGKIDVNKIANFFGGGGHKNASGCTIRDLSIDQVAKMVLTKVKAEFTNQRIDINEDK